MFTLKEQNNGKWTFGIKKGRRFVQITDKSYSKKSNAKRGLKTMLKKEMKELNKPSSKGKRSKK